MPQLSDLRLFVEAARLGSLSAAARVLERTPAAASASLKRLEDELGIRLLERNTRNLRLTPGGLVYHERVAAGLALLDEANVSIQENCCDFTGEIRMTASIDFARQWLRPLVDEFQTAHPRLRVILQLEDHSRDLVAEPLDLALRFGHLPDSALVARHLADNRRIAVASPDYFRRYGRPQHPHELSSHNCLTYFQKQSPFRRWSFQRENEVQVVEVQGDRTTNDGSLVRDWTLAGYGIAYKGEWDVRGDLRAGRLEPALPGWQGDDMPLSAVYPGTGPRPHRVTALVRYLRERLEELRQADGVGT